MKKLYLILIASLILPILLLASVSAFNVTSECKQLTENNELYVMNQSFDVSGNCFYISGENITLDMNGFTVTGDYDTAGVQMDSGINFTIMNGTFQNCYDGITMSDLGRANIYNIRFLNISNVGIYVIPENSRIENITMIYGTIYPTYNDFIGIDLDGFTAAPRTINNYLKNIFINTTEQDAQGIIHADSVNATIENLVIITNTSGPTIGFNANDMTVDPNTLWIINATYNDSAEEVTQDARIQRYWYYQTYINDSLGSPLNNVNITLFDKDSIYFLNITSNSLGYTAIINLLDYIQTSADRNYSSPYNIYALVTSYSSQNHTLNVTEVRNYLDSFTLILTPIPVVPVIPADDGLTRTILKLLVGFLALVVLGISLLVMKWWDQRSKIEAEDVVKYFIVLLLAIILVGVLASIIWGML